MIGVDPGVDPGADAAPGMLPSGTPVEVCNRFCRSWVSGFDVVATAPGGYRLRRRSDQYVLPALFLADELRPV